MSCRVGENFKGWGKMNNYSSYPLKNRGENRREKEERNKREII